MTRLGLTFLILLILQLGLGTAGAQTPARPRPPAAKKALTPPTPTPIPRNVMILRPEDVANRILTDSYVAKEANYSADLSRVAYARILGTYDFVFTFETGYEKSKFENATGVQNYDLVETLPTKASLKKPFSSGTTALIEFDRTQARYNLFATATTDDRYTQEWAGLTLTQNLWRNFFGAGDRAALTAAEKQFKASRVDRAVSLQNLVLAALQSYWDAYVAQETFQEALNSRDRAEKLVEAVRRKTSFGYSSPGALPQIQADYELRLQNVKSASADYLKKLDALLTLLRLPKDTEIRFVPVQDIPLPPATQPVEFDNLRAVKTIRLRKEAAEESYDASRWNNRADFSLVGKVYSSGTERTTSEADNEFFSGTRPKYYVGVKYEYQFGSGSQDEEILNAKLNRDLQDTVFERRRLEIQDQLADLERQIQSTYNVAISLKNQRALREKVINELNRTYNQGRTDIKDLIDAMDKYYTSGRDLIAAIGNYQVTLNRFAALRDELIPDPSIPEAHVQSGEAQ